MKMKKRNLKIIYNFDRLNKHIHQWQVLEEKSDFKNSIIEIRRKIYIPISGFNPKTIGEKVEDWKTRATQETLNTLNSEVIKIGDKFNLNGLWLEAVESFIFSNSWETPLLSSLIVEQSETEKYDKPLLKLYIPEDLTLKQVKDAWPEIKKLQNKSQFKTKGKIQKPKNFHINKMIFELKKSGLKTAEINTLVKERFSNKYEVLNYVDMNERVKQYKRYMGFK